MFEERLGKLSEELGGFKKEFFILTHKKHGREIYFRNHKEAIKFIEIKFSSPFKKVVYNMIKFGILQPFLKKIRLSEKFGDVIFVGGQIKCFDLEKGEVLSLPRLVKEKNNFLKSKEVQKNVAKKGFAPFLYEINKELPFSREEMLQIYLGGNDFEVFRTIISYYKSQKMKRIFLKDYIKFLRRELSMRKITDSFLSVLFEKILEEYNPKTSLIISKVHGDFSKEQILLKGGKYVFTDWCWDEGVIIRDLAKFFRDEEDFLRNKKFRKILKIYPLSVRKNLKLYLILNEISSVIQRGEVSELSLKRIRNLGGSDV